MGSAGASPAVSGALAGNFCHRAASPISDLRSHPANRRGRRLATPGAGVLPDSN